MPVFAVVAAAMAGMVAVACTQRGAGEGQQQDRQGQLLHPGDRHCFPFPGGHRALP